MNGEPWQRPLDETDIERFRKEGFIAVEAITSPEETGRLREIFAKLFSGRVGWKKGSQFDLAGTDDEGEASLPQILDPGEFAPELRETHYRKQALAIAQQLLGPGTVPFFEHAILKPAERGGATPWHQDEAHRSDAGVHYDQVSIWMPLQPATVENGCIRYIPGSHLGPVLRHRSLGDDPRVMALECVGSFQESDMVCCPLPPGGAVIHHGRTLHSAGPNSTTMPRMAYVLAFRGPVREESAFLGYPWNAEKRTAAQARYETWQNRGGVLGRVQRGATTVAVRGLRKLRRRLRQIWAR